MNDRQIATRAQALVQKGLCLYGDCDNPPPAKPLTSDTVDTLTHQQVVQGVTALLMQCNITSGSVADIDLYKLNSVYLRDHSARKAINEILSGRQII
jgi:hypothetical protein